MSDYPSKHRYPVYRARKKTIRQQRKILMVERLGGKCSLCGYNKCVAALHFHHNDPSEKLFMISQGLEKPMSVLEAEVDKCSLLCANCHHEVESEVFDFLHPP